MAGAKKKVIVVGGGISGLTVAHELSLRDEFQVTVLERNAMCGGKARSLRYPDGNVGEHAMRGYMQPYSTLYGTMKEIPFEGGTVYDNLVYVDVYMSAGKDEVLLATKDPSAAARHKMWVDVYEFFRRQGVPHYEIWLFIYKVLRLVWMNDARAHAELDRVSYQDYLSYTKRSDAFRRTLIKIPDILTAAKPFASAYSVAGMLVSIFTAYRAKLDNRRLATSIMNGPTSERFIDPWVAHLRSRGVALENGARVSKILHDQRRITGVEINGDRVETADDYVICVPHNILDALLAGDIERMAPSLSRLELLGDSWSNGIQYFMSRIPPAWEKHVGRGTLVLDSPWSIVFMIQANDPASWSGVQFPPGTVANLSLVFSNANAPGPVTGKLVGQCTKQELFAECIAQIGDDQDDLFDRAAMDPDFQYLSRAYYEEHKEDYAGFDTSLVAESDEVIVNDGPLFVAKPNAQRNEPGNATEIDNLFVAGEFTHGRVPVPTMEGVNESGKRCAQCIYEKYGLPYDAKRYGTIELPFPVLRAIDGFFYRLRKAVPLYPWLLLGAAVIALIIFWLQRR
jgi:uncharacterized protein with NAD-binding domain and iron-sulfur cluster